eukprot:358672-Chlamydomonas_euryale.AAC.3
MPVRRWVRPLRRTRVRACAGMNAMHGGVPPLVVSTYNVHTGSLIRRAKQNVSMAKFDFRVECQHGEGRLPSGLASVESAYEPHHHHHHNNNKNNNYYNYNSVDNTNMYSNKRDSNTMNTMIINYQRSARGPAVGIAAGMAGWLIGDVAGSA